MAQVVDQSVVDRWIGIFDALNAALIAEGEEEEVVELTEVEFYSDQIYALMDDEADKDKAYQIAAQMAQTIKNQR